MNSLLFINDISNEKEVIIENISVILMLAFFCTTSSQYLDQFMIDTRDTQLVIKKLPISDMNQLRKM